MITEIEVTDYGIDHAQYFTGHGTAYTNYEHSALGAGDSFDEALSDAIDSMCQHEGVDCSKQDTDQLITDSVSQEYLDHPRDTVTNHIKLSAAQFGLTPDEVEALDDHELYYYVGLRWNT